MHRFLTFLPANRPCITPLRYAAHHSNRKSNNLLCRSFSLLISTNASSLQPGRNFPIKPRGASTLFTLFVFNADANHSQFGDLIISTSSSTNFGDLADGSSRFELLCFSSIGCTFSFTGTGCGKPKSENGKT